jgi:ribose 5-phosphate isomerase B
MKILIATDHAGFELKEKIKDFLVERGYDVKDFGAYKFEENDDYPDFVIPLAKEISNNSDLKGVILGGSGQGEAIVANKFKHVRAALCYGGNESSEIVKLSREHNNTNILSLGARFLSHDQALELTLLWLQTEFTGDERHVRRIHEIDSIESDNNEPLYE